MTQRNDSRANEVLDAVIADLKKRFTEGEETVTKDGVVRINPSAATIKAAVELLDRLEAFTREPPDATAELRKSLPFPTKDKEY